MSVPKQWDAVSAGRRNLFWAGRSNGSKPPHQRATCFLRDRQLAQSAEKDIFAGLENNLAIRMGGGSMTDEGGISGCGGGYGINGSNTEFDYCYCPDCCAAFRDYAQKLYPDLQAANTQWGTSFKTWAEVKPVPLEVIRKRNDKNYALWVDHKFFMEQLFFEEFRKIKNKIGQKHPFAKIGLTNPGYLGQRTLLSGENYALWGPEETLSLKYYGPVDSIAYRSFQKEDTVRLSWWGYGSDLEMVRAEPWWAAFNKIRVFTWWMSGGYANDSTPTWSTNNLYSQWFGHTKRSLELKKTAKDLVDGIGRITMETPLPKSETALLYSQSSMYVSGAERKDYSYYFRSEINWRNLLVSGNWCYDYVYESAPDLAARLKKYKTVILPYSIALSRKTQKTLIQFAADGGTVITDVRPGAFDEHGSPLKGAGELWKLCDKKQMQQRSSGSIRYSSVSTGQGKIILLGRVPPVNAQTMKMISSVLSDIPVRRIAWLDGSLENRYDLYSFEKDGAQYLGIVGSCYIEQNRSSSPVKNPKSESAKLTLPAKRHIYNVRTHKYLGETDAVDLSLKADHPEFFAFFPVPLEWKDVRTGAEYDRKTHSIVLSGKWNMDKDIKRLVAVDVFDPDGSRKASYCGKYWIDHTGFKHSVPLGFDDPAGEWKICFRDVVCGNSISHKINVKR